MVENEEGINPFQLPVKCNKLLQIPYIPVLVKKSMPELKVPDEVISEQHNPLVEKNFVHLLHEKQ